MGVAEQRHPLWGGEIDVPSFIAFQQTPLQTFWPAVICAIAAYEVFSVFTFARPYDLFYTEAGGLWQIRNDQPRWRLALSMCAPLLESAHPWASGTRLTFVRAARRARFDS